jgi:7tm Odorant receptor
MNDIEELFFMISENLRSEPKLDLVEKRIKRIDKIFKAFWTSALFTTSTIVLVPFYSGELPYKMWFPYDYRQSKILFWLSAAYQELDTFCFSGADIALEILPVIFMSYVLGMLDQLCDRLEQIKIPKTLNSDGSINQMMRCNNKKEFERCIKYHMAIVDICEKVKNVFGPVLMIRGLLSTLVLCTTSYALTLVRNCQHKKSNLHFFSHFLYISRYHRSKIDLISSITLST